MGLRRPRPGKQMSLTTSEQQQFPADDGTRVVAISVKMTAEFRYLLLQCTGCKPVASHTSQGWHVSAYFVCLRVHQSKR